MTMLETFDAKSGDLNVIVETPRGSRNKYKYDDRRRLFKVHSLLPKGMTFPFDYGFIPSTVGDDGDPLDVLVLMEEPAPAGFLVPARLIGVIEAEQTEDGKTERNDRLIAVATESHHHGQVASLDELEKEALEEIEHFFISYNEQHGKQFKPAGRHGPRKAKKLVKDGAKRFRKQQEEGSKERLLA